MKKVAAPPEAIKWDDDDVLARISLLYNSGIKYTNLILYKYIYTLFHTKTNA